MDLFAGKYKIILSITALLMPVSYSYCSEESQLDCNLTKVWGPGLNPQSIILPARYFFIQAVKTTNESFTSSLNRTFNVTVDGLNEEGLRCRVWVQVLDRLDGSYIARYKLYEPCWDLSIEVKYGNDHVAQSPYRIAGMVLTDSCNCPQGTLEDMIEKWQCKLHPQLVKDLKPFQKIDWNELRTKIISQFDKPHSVSICHYAIKSNIIYRKCYGKYVGFNMFSDSVLTSLSRKYFLPDMEFFINLGDWPLAKHVLPRAYPIFSWCGSEDTYDIVMPTYDLTQSSLDSMGRVMLDMLSVQGNTGLPWEQRIEKLFWRGRDSNRVRLNLILLGKKHPDLFNVSLTNFFFFKNEADLYGPKTEHVSFFKFFDYKYQICIDGTVAAYRLPYLLAGGSLLFKPSSQNYEHFYNDLEPHVHYKPVKEDLSDLLDQLQWARSHDSEAKAIAQRGREYANNNLLSKDILCYHAQLLWQFNEKIVSKVRIEKDMEKVEDDSITKCDCNFKIKTEL